MKLTINEKKIILTALSHLEDRERLYLMALIDTYNNASNKEDVETNIQFQEERMKGIKHLIDKVEQSIDG